MTFYKTRYAWLYSPRSEDRVELWYGAYVDTDNKVKTFVASTEDDVPEDALVTETGILQIKDACEKANSILSDLIETDKFAKKIEKIKLARRIRFYHYGVSKNAKGKLVTFLCKNENSIPRNALVVNSGKMLADIAQHRANLLKKSYRERTPLPPEPQLEKIPRYSFSVGDVVVHTDSDGHHSAVVLNKGKQYSTLLFVTSNPLWNPHCREVTTDENILLGFPINSRSSYFAPVVRHNEEMVETGKSFPLHRVEELITEFKVGRQ